MRGKGTTSKMTTGSVDRLVRVKFYGPGAVLCYLDELEIQVSSFLFLPSGALPLQDSSELSPSHVLYLIIFYFLLSPSRTWPISFRVSVG